MHRWLFIVLMLGLSSCYSFKGISVPENAKTVKVEFFQNEARLQVASLSQDFTELLKEEIEKNTNLRVTNRADADLIFKGSIASYAVSSIAPTGNETTALNRITMGVQVEFENNLEEKGGWESRFNRFAQFESSKSLTDVQDELNATLNEEIVNLIINKAFSNW